MSHISVTWLTSLSKHLFYIFVLAVAPTQSADNLLHSTVLCENENFHIFSLHCSYTNVTSGPLVLQSFLTNKQYFYQYFHNHSIFKDFYLISSQPPGL